MIDYSVVTTVYNDEKEIEQFVRNICQQTIKPKEIIIADGGSKDNTCNIIKSIHDPIVKITLLCNGRLNVSEGFNFAIKNANTEYVGVVGVGNIYENDFFEHLISTTIQNDLDACYAAIRGLDVTPFSIKYNRTILNGETGQRMNIASNHGVLIKKSIFEELGFFYEKFIFAGEDAEFYELVRKRGYKTLLNEDAILRWITPQNWSEYFTQVKNYSIAIMQILPTEVILKQILKAILPFIGFILLLIVAPFIGAMLAIAKILYLFIKAKRLTDEHKDFVLWEAKRILPVFFYIRYSKYLKSKYKVKR